MKKIAIIIIAIFCAGCAGLSNTKQSFKDISGDLKITELYVNGNKIQTPSNATIGVKGDSVFGNTGCNSYFSTFTMQNDNTIRFSYAGSTRMMCHDDIVNTFEYEFLRGLEGTFSINYDDDTITLSNENIKIVAEK